MTIHLTMPDIRELKPRITVFGVGGAGGNAVNNMITAGLQGVDFVVGNTDAQALTLTKSERMIQMGVQVTQGLGAGSQPEVGRAAAEEVIDEIRDHLSGAHMVFVTAGMGGGTGTGAAPVIARAAKEMGILTVGVVTKPFQFEGVRRMRLAEAGIQQLQSAVDTLLIIPNQNLFRVANEKTTFADAFAMADQVLYSGVACITDLMVKEGLINLDFADVRAVMGEMGKAMMGTGEASGEKRALRSAEAAISNPLIDDVSMKGARGLLVSITGGRDLTLYEVDEAATRIREEVDQDANIIVGATFDESLEGIIRVSVVATGIDLEQQVAAPVHAPEVQRLPDARRPVPARPPVAAKPIEAAAAERVSAMSAETAPASQETYYDEPARHESQGGHAEASFEDVQIRPLNKPAIMFPDPVDERPTVAVEEAPAKTFIPPAPERPQTRAVRMPAIEDLPRHTQEQLRARREPQAEGVEKPKMGLLQRLAAVGLGRRDEPIESTAPAPIRRAVAPPIERAPVPQRAPEPARLPESVADYARRPGPARQVGHGLDQHGRQAPVQNNTSMDDDQLDIPAFLRRQAK